MAELDPDDPSDEYLRQYQRSAIGTAINGLGDNPDDAAKAVQLSNATGVPAPVINADLDNFAHQHKAKLVSGLIDKNQYLQSFINRNPMAAKVANDSYAQLDELSQHISDSGWLGKTTISDAFMKAFGDQPMITRATDDPDWREHPFLSSLGATGATMVELPLRALAGTISAIGHTVGDPIFGNEGTQKGIDVFMDPGTQATVEGVTAGTGNPAIAALGQMGAAALTGIQKLGAARTWFENARMPPKGVSAEVDKLRADTNKQGIDELKEADKIVQSTPALERDPQIIEDFVKEHPTHNMQLDGDAAVRLYGDKVPEPGDGLLGDVPGIVGQLELAKATGSPIDIPLGTWLAKIDPDAKKVMFDDLLSHPEGITANEVKLEAERKEAEKAATPEGQSAPKESEPLPEAMPTMRAALASEPLLSVGDRKLTLTKIGESLSGPSVKPMFADFHDFQITDEKGNNVGTVNLSTQKDGKQLYVEMINGVNGLGPRDFGPALMRDLLRQIKEQFPEAESITGHRVSGARDKAGSYMAPSAMPVIKLDAPGWDHVENWTKVLEGGQWEKFSPTLQAYIKPYAERSLEDRRLIDAVNEELDRIAPQKLGVQAADRIQTTGGEGQVRGTPTNPTGAYVAYREAYPILLYSLEGPDAIGTARHEAIHHLYRYGFFKPEEWTALAQASRENGWIEQFGIDRRYPKGSEGLKVEESIADAYKNWEAGRIGEVSPEVEGIFARMKQFFDALRKRIGELLGKDPTWEDIFEKVSTGEVGRREGTKPIVEGAYNEKLSAPEGDARDYQRANTYGIPVDAFRQYDKRLQEQYANDLAQAEKRAMEEQGRSQTRAWKDERKALRQEVASEIKARPDVAADLFFGAGELYGKKVPLTSVKLDASKLNDAQKAMLPRSYYGEHGLDPDDAANLFGYGSGDAMVVRLGAYNVPKLLAKMSAKDFVSRVTDMETDRQMQLKHGVLENNIMDAAKEQALGEAELNRVHEETLALHAAAMKMNAGVDLPASRANMAAAVRKLFEQTPISSVDSGRLTAKIGSMGRQIEAHMRAGEWDQAFQLAQKREFAMTTASEMAKVEKAMGAFDRTMRQMSRREVPSIAQDYTNFIHDIMVRVGKPVRRSVQDIATEIAAGEYATLSEFVEGKETFHLREVAVADILLDPGFRKDFKDLTVDEFQAVKTSIDSMIANGRDEKKITKAGTEADLLAVKGEMINQLQTFQERTYDAKGGRWMGPIPPPVAKVLRTYGAAHIQMENLFNRWDHDNPNGVFQQYIMRDLVDAANSESAKRKVYANKLLALDDKADLKKLVDNAIFKVPNSDQVMQLNRGNLRAVMLNAGNASNLDKLARGYGLTPEVVMGWLNKHATKEDWDWAQKMGDIFGELKGEADQMYRRVSGVAPESIPIEAFDTPHGQYKGWYYPVIYHPEFEGRAKKLMGPDALEQEGFVRAAVANGYTKKRTSYAGPMALDLDMLPSRMSQMIHDIETRPAIINASKIFYDKDVRAAVFKHFGGEWRDMLVPYLVDVANSSNYVAKDQRIFYNASEFIRQNMISTLVGLNPGTVLKHGPTALAQSLHEVGPINFLKAMKGLFSINERTGETNWQFALKTSEELQRRHQNYIETLGGAANELQPTTGYAKLRTTIQSLSAKPVAISDLLSAVPTWLAQYEKTLGEGEPHGDAAYMADRAVRRAHGSVAITNRSAIMRTGALGQWFSSVYGFFNHIMNRQYEMLWKAGEMVGNVKDGNYRDAMQRAPELTSMLFAYVLAPALIEEMVTPLVSSDNESWGKKAAKGIGFTLGASWVGVRDVANALLNARDPSVGLISTAAKTITDFARDFGKEAPYSKEHAGKMVRDGATLLGALSGVVPAEVGKVAQFGLGVKQGQERPKGPWGWLVGARYGTLNKHSATLDEWMRHH